MQVANCASSRLFSVNKRFKDENIAVWETWPYKKVCIKVTFCFQKWLIADMVSKNHTSSDVQTERRDS